MKVRVIGTRFKYPWVLLCSWDTSPSPSCALQPSLTDLLICRGRLVMHDGLLPTHEPNMPAYTEKLPNMDQLQCPLKRSAADGQTKGSLSLRSVMLVVGEIRANLKTHGRISI
ncbi:hypothetical protein SCLCIDRAFT_527805 [Scleroderma citrinum Foug A]|uniref:Uncharacterized protein n=1 Tax=Scleroderma citrinum Foug A TaxID=1036808 RepID=A0A0C3ECD7_9AGAM|nr:hypothetical protein SCLCIDRAFT_527805 [Scleroderma citrinum Foug A]